MKKEIPYNDPIILFAHFAQQNGAIFFESTEFNEYLGRYSFIAIDPFAVMKSKNGVITLNDQTIQGDPFAVLANQLSLFQYDFDADLPPFQGGVAGYWGYDLFQHLEKIPNAKTDDFAFPDLILGFYDLMIAFDNLNRRAWIIAQGPHEQAKRRLNGLLKQLQFQYSEFSFSNKVCDANAIQSYFNKTTYTLAVEKVIQYILAGDIFEANLSQRFSTVLPENLSSFELYNRLRYFSPTPFSAYLNFNNVAIASASPERFLKLTNKHVESRPIKGTRPRGTCKKTDLALATDLLNSEKDHAENVMIVDLLRNDLSRVCKDHSIHVSQLCGLESFSTVHHLVSVIHGELKANYNAVDLLRATFPGGSITGAPKIRAMEIISELEPTVRGPYCGAIGYIGFNGDMDTSIAIRSFFIKDNRVAFQVGGAVVLDSDPVAEYEETLTKASGLQKALLQII